MRSWLPANFQGRWKGEGKGFGKTTRPEMNWEFVLDGKFTRLLYRLEIGAGEKDPRRFEGHGYYKQVEPGRYRGNWFDSQGAVHPIEATFENNTLTANWGTPQTEVGKTVYRLVDQTTMELIDSVKGKDGNWRDFHRATLKKQ